MSDNNIDSHCHRITEPCQGRLGKARCMWPFTFKFRGKWLCRACIGKWYERDIERAARRFQRKQKGGNK